MSYTNKSLKNDVTDPQSSAYVDASAGSGKTTLLIDRIVRLLLHGTSPAKILCITFTNAAAEEMSERLRSRLLSLLVLPDSELKRVLTEVLGPVPSPRIMKAARALFLKTTSESLQIQTLHGFCAKILQRMHIINLNDGLMSDRGKIIEEKEKRELLHASFNEVIFKDVRESFEILLKKYEAAYIFDLIYDLSCSHTSHNISHEEAKTKIYGVFGISASDASLQIINEYLSSCDTIMLSEVVKVLGQADNIVSKRAAAAIQNFLQGPSEKTFYGYVNILLTADFKPRARLPLNAKMSQDSVAVKEFLLSEQQKLSRILELNQSIISAEINLAFNNLLTFTLKNFSAKKNEANLFEYSDLINQAINIIQNSDDKMALLYSIDMSVDHLLVDEAQDLSESQWLMIKTITEEFFAGAGQGAKTRTIFIVGDFKQAIFGFQGAAPHVFQEIRHFFRKKVIEAGKLWHEIQLETCYRCAPEILHVVDKVCNSNRDSFADIMIKHHSINEYGQGLVRCHEVDETADEKEQKQTFSWAFGEEIKSTSYNPIALSIAQMVDGWLKEGKRINGSHIVCPQDIMILFRKRSIVQDHLVEALTRCSVPTSNLAARALGNSLYMYDILAALQFASQPFDDLNLVALLKSPPFNYGDKQIVEICQRDGNSLWAKVQEIKLLRDIIENSRIMDLQCFLSWYLNDVYPIKNKETQKFMDYLLFFCRSTEPLKISLNTFIAFIDDLMSKKQQQLYDNKSVRITTIHSAKGLEAPIVILADAHTSETMGANKFLKLDDITILHNPDLKKLLTQYNTKQDAEKMRLLYVAMTRAKNELHVFGSSKSKDSWYRRIKDALFS